MNRFFRTAGAGALLVLLSACPAGTGTNVAGIDRGGITVGQVTGFGSVYVNSRRYITDTATVTVDGTPAAVADLRLGYLVRIEALIPDDGSDPRAETIRYDSVLTGPVSAVQAAAASFTALGQAVATTNETFFDAAIPGAALAGLQAGDVVRVSGFRDAADGLLATRVELAAGGPPFQLSGIARNVDPARQEFEIGGLVVDYGSAASIAGFPQGQPESGQMVLVRGEQPGGTGAFLATSLEYVADRVMPSPGDEGEVEGVISRFASATDFDVDGITVTTDADTSYERGTVANLAANARVEISGSFQADGRLLAGRVEFRSAGVLQLEGRLDSVDPASGQLVIFGVTVQAAGLTNLASLAAGDCVEVRGSEAPGDPGVLAATRLEREDDCGEAKVRGYVSALAEPEFTIFGVTVRTDGGTDFPSSQAAFFATALGRLVKVEGSESNGVLNAEEIEFAD